MACMALKKSLKTNADNETKEVTKTLGRPTKYDENYCQMLIDHMDQGLSFETFAAVIKVNQDTLHEWVKVHPSFSEAKKVAFNKCLLFWEKLGIDHIINTSDSESQGEGVGSSKSRSLNSAVWVFNMKNRFKWRDKQPDEADVVVNNVNNLSDDELDKKLNEKLNQQKKK